MSNREKGKELWQACHEEREADSAALIGDPDTAVNFRGALDTTPLHLAVCNNALPTVRLLLQRDDVILSPVNAVGETPFDSACSEGHVAMAELLLSDRRLRLSGLHRACAEEGEGATWLMREGQGGEVNAETPQGYTPLWVGCSLGRYRAVRALLREREVDPNRAGADGRSPLYVTCQRGNVRLVEMLAWDPRVDVNRPDLRGRSPLWLAASRGSLSVVRVLLASPARVDCRSKPAGLNYEIGEFARRRGYLAVAMAIEAYVREPLWTRLLLRVSLGFDRWPSFPFLSPFSPFSPVNQLTS